MPSRRRLQQYAIAISVISVFYNTAEGVVSIVFGAEASSRSLVFFGIQSGVEVISALMVTWRFTSVIKPGDENHEDLSVTSPQVIRAERIATTGIGSLLVALSLAAFGTSAASLAAHDTPATALPSIIIAGSATGVMIVLWLIKRYLARALNSSTLNGEALCSLECTQLSVILLIGSLIYHFWHGGWWVDSATAIVIGGLFGWEGIKMIRWARSGDFDGGCCGDCHPRGPKADEEALRDGTPLDDKRETSSSCCSESSVCCERAKKGQVKDTCCSPKAGVEVAGKKEESPSSCSALGGCCGFRKKELPKEDCCSKTEAAEKPCDASSGCCGTSSKALSEKTCGTSKGYCGGSKAKVTNSNCCSRERNEGDTTVTTAIPQDEKEKDIPKSSCGVSRGCCGGSKKDEF